MTRQELAAMIDHTILKADATHEDVRKATQIAIDCGCKSIAINGQRHQVLLTVDCRYQYAR